MKDNVKRAVSELLSETSTNILRIVKGRDTDGAEFLVIVARGKSSKELRLFLVDALKDKA